MTQKSLFGFDEVDDPRAEVMPALPSSGALLPFGGATFDQEFDGERLTTQYDRVSTLMADGAWRTLREIVVACGGSEGGVSARLRDMRKPEFGGVEVERRRRGDPKAGLFEYRVPTRSAR